jgi:hypothetical protein
MAVLPSYTNEKLDVVRFQLVRRQIYFERLFSLELLSNWSPFAIKASVSSARAARPDRQSTKQSNLKLRRR